ncbi:MAG: formate/nitrite transporter family protein, partial [Nitrososphaerota archaeon]
MTEGGSEKREIFGLDAFSPREVAERVETVGVAKARLPLLSMSVLGVLAGGFIGLGALYFTLIASDQALTLALSRLLGGLVFSLGLILVVVAGAELFTGNNLLVMAWVAKRITTTELLRNFIITYISNLVGALGLVLLVYLSNQWAMGGGEVGLIAVRIAAYKTSLTFTEAF